MLRFSLQEEKPKEQPMAFDKEASSFLQTCIYMNLLVFDFDKSSWWQRNRGPIFQPLQTVGSGHFSKLAWGDLYSLQQDSKMVLCPTESPWATSVQVWKTFAQEHEHR